MAGDERLYLVDASIYVFRAWHTLPDTLTDAQGQVANATYGFADFLHRLMQSVEARRIAVAFDESLAWSFRNEIYPAYKANRAPAPDELKRQFQDCQRLAEGLGLPVLKSAHYEADDLIGTLAARGRSEGLAVTVVSADKDLAQLVLGDRDRWWDFARDRSLDRKGVERQFGVRPEQIPDQLAIAGDKIDNIPGVPGIGMPTAARLLHRFRTLESLLAQIPSVAAMPVRGAARLSRLLDEHQETVRLARQLTGIHCAVDLASPPLLERQVPDAEGLMQLFGELAFSRERQDRWQSLVEGLFGSADGALR